MTQASAPSSGCIFCDALAHTGPDSLIAYRGRLAFIILNKFPYNNGHVMVVPNRHAARLTELAADEMAEMMQLAQSAERALTVMYQPHGFNMGINIGRPAGAGVLDHLHLHVVPRWNGDTSFMTVFDETRVLPEALPATAERLGRALAESLPSRE